MNRLAIGLTAAWFALGATQALAVTTEQRYATITGTAGASSPGACSEGYADQCPTSSCSCVEVSGATVGKVTGQPSISGAGTANLFLTFDNGASTVSAAGELYALLWSRGADHHPRRKALLRDA